MVRSLPLLLLDNSSPKQKNNYSPHSILVLVWVLFFAGVQLIFFPVHSMRLCFYLGLENVDNLGKFLLLLSSAYRFQAFAASPVRGLGVHEKLGRGTMRTGDPS